jgi:hypothetical protein
MSKVVRLTESDLVRLVKKVINEQSEVTGMDAFERIRKMGGNIKERKLSDGTIELSLINYKNNTIDWIFYSNGRAKNFRDKQMYTFFFKPGEETVSFRKDLGKEPVKVGDKISAGNLVCIGKGFGENMAKYRKGISFYGNVTKVEPTQEGFYEITVKGEMSDGKTKKTGCTKIDTKYDNEVFKGSWCVESMSMDYISDSHCK